MADKRNLFPRIQGTWPDVIADMESTAEEYRERGWEVIECHPGDVTVLEPDEHSERYGFDILLPGDEYGAIEERLDEGDVAFDSYTVYKATDGDIVYLVVAMEDRHAELAVVYPAYYAIPQAQEMFAHADANDTMYSHLRKLERGEVITVTHDDPEPFYPDE